MIEAKSDISIHKTEKSRLESVDFEDLKFGEILSDHMYVVDYRSGEWMNPRVIPYGPIEFSPALSIFHYGQGVFEGMKAFHYTGDKVNIFRPEDHYERFTRSCKRVNIPPIDPELFMDGLDTLVGFDRKWVPVKRHQALYIRPFVIAADVSLGLRTSGTYQFFILTTPVGNYYKGGARPVALTTMPEYVRSVRGGVGEAKVPGNYAASLYPASLAQAEGFAQVLWLDAVELKYVEEVGTMNIFFVIDDVLVTPELKGSILNGITRRTAIALARARGIDVVERMISIDEIMTAGDEGRLTESFGTGTAAVVTPVGRIHHKGHDIYLNTEEMGPVARVLYTDINDVQYGDKNDTHGWCHVI